MVEAETPINEKNESEPTDTAPQGLLKRKKKLVLTILVILVVAAAFLLIFYRSQTGRLPGAPEVVNPVKISAAEQEGRKYSNNTCTGNEVKKLTHLPLDAENITNVLPYGGVVAAHVMPISHGYIWPGRMGDPRDKYNVYAMADSTLFSISSRSINVDSGQAKQTEYQLNFSVSCVEFYYYDLMTSLTPELQKYLDDHPSPGSAGNYVSVNIPIKAGQLVGKIGAQTLDYAVWDFNKTLTGYIVPEHYDGDAPRTHLVSPFDYTTDDVRKVLVSKLMRSVEPIEGKVDYDIDGKLIGGWFQEGTNYYEQGGDRYWAGHLAIVPDYLDPTLLLASIGTYKGTETAQFALSRDAPDPKTVGIEAGLVKYDLFEIDHTLADGSRWDRFTPAKGIKGKTNGPSQGCALFQLVETRKLKAEFFASKTCSAIPGLTSQAKTYIR
ncbi:MAG: hypothetical protein ACREGJ_03925 [Candidatus Saccharimonadales bacterium]